MDLTKICVLPSSCNNQMKTLKLFYPLPSIITFCSIFYHFFSHKELVSTFFLPASYVLTSIQVQPDNPPITTKCFFSLKTDNWFSLQKYKFHYVNPRNTQTQFKSQWKFQSSYWHTYIWIQIQFYQQKKRPPRNKSQLKRIDIEKDFTLEWFCERFPCGGKWDKVETFGERKWCEGLGWGRDQTHHGHWTSWS